MVDHEDPTDEEEISNVNAAKVAATRSFICKALAKPLKS